MPPAHDVCGMLWWLLFLLLRDEDRRSTLDEMCDMMR